jgi:DNA-binding NarL/FixJ family response regulator
VIDTRREVMTHAKDKAPDAAAPQGRQVQEASLRRGLLSARELEILFARARGLSTKEIAHELRIDDATVRVVLRRVRAKLF